MDLEKVDFYEILLDEGDPFYREIFRYEKTSVNTWLKENLKLYGKIESYGEVTPSKDVVEFVSASGYEHIPHQCHYSAKRLNQLVNEYKFITGFVTRNDYPYSIITHSFNTYKEKIYDFARLENNNVALIDDETLPHFYWGIELPDEFILEFEKETGEQKSMKPLLFEWIQRNNLCIEKK